MKRNNHRKQNNQRHNNDITKTFLKTKVSLNFLNKKQIINDIRTIIMFTLESKYKNAIKVMDYNHYYKF